MKTTIIDILNKIANGEEPPKKISFKNKIYWYVCKDKDYYLDGYSYDEALFDSHIITDILNDEVEILETTITYNQDNIENNKQDKKIEKLKTHKEINKPDYYADILEVYDVGESEIDEATSFIVDKINEIIEVLNDR